MKTSCTLAFILFVMMIAQTMAAPDDVQISVTTTKLDEKRQSSISQTLRTKEIAYKVTVTNKTFKTLQDVKIKYMVIFNEGGRIGAPGGKKVEMGVETIANLPSNSPTTILTKSLTLTKESMNDGWVAGDTTARVAEDKIDGIWFRAYIGDELIGEFFNPSSIPKKNEWKN